MVLAYIFDWFGLLGRLDLVCSAWYDKGLYVDIGGNEYLSCSGDIVDPESRLDPAQEEFALGIDPNGPGYLRSGG